MIHWLPQQKVFCWPSKMQASFLRQVTRAPGHSRVPRQQLWLATQQQEHSAPTIPQLVITTQVPHPQPATRCQERAPPPPQPPPINSPATRTTNPRRLRRRPVSCPVNIVRPTTRRRHGRVIMRSLLPKLWTSRRRGLITIGRFQAIFTDRKKCHTISP